jgi:hypothetical protein
MKNNKTRNILIAIVLLILVGGIGYLGYEYFNLKNKLDDPDYLKNLQTQQLTSNKEKILSRLSAILLLPDEVNPKIATINNVDDLRKENPQFYKNAQNGDTLVLYSELAIIYRDSSNKIINIAPIVPEK